MTNSGHWYDLDGKSCHTVIGSSTGRPRPTTVADARKNGWLPSVTGILKVIHKESLLNWRIEQAILASLTLPRTHEEPAEDFAKRVVKDMNAKSSRAAARGTDLHDACERYLMGRQVRTAPDLMPMFEQACKWIDDNVIDVLATEQTLVNPIIGYAGKVDLVANIKEIGLSILDFKTQGLKSGKKGFIYTFYDEWALQLEAYRQAWNLTHDQKVDNIISVIISSEEPAPCEHKVWDGDYWETFLAAFQLWCWQKSYNPSKTE